MEASEHVEHLGSRGRQQPIGRVIQRLCILAVCGWLLGCVTASHASDADPLDALVAWHDALAEGDTARAWELLSTSAREGLDPEAFEDLYAHRRKALTIQAKELVAWAKTHPPAERAEVMVDGRRFLLVRTRDGWRIDGRSINEPSAEGSEAQ